MPGCSSLRERGEHAAGRAGTFRPAFIQLKLIQSSFLPVTWKPGSSWSAVKAPHGSAERRRRWAWQLLAGQPAACLRAAGTLLN